MLFSYGYRQKQLIATCYYPSTHFASSALIHLVVQIHFILNVCHTWVPKGNLRMLTFTMWGKLYASHTYCLSDGPVAWPDKFCVPHSFVSLHKHLKEYLITLWPNGHSNNNRGNLRWILSRDHSANCHFWSISQWLLLNKFSKHSIIWYKYLPIIYVSFFLLFAKGDSTEIYKILALKHYIYTIYNLHIQKKTFC